MIKLRPVCCRADEIEAAVHSAVDDVSSIQPAFVFQIFLKLGIDVLHDRLETVNIQSLVKYNKSIRLQEIPIP